MIQKNPFLKYMIKDEKKDVFHSSAYAKAQSGDGIGAASSESYNVRVNLNQNRQRVRGYNDSRVMTEARMNGPRAKVYTAPEKETGNGGAAREEMSVIGRAQSTAGEAKNAVGRTGDAVGKTGSMAGRIGNAAGRTGMRAEPSGRAAGRPPAATKNPGIRIR